MTALRPLGCSVDELLAGDPGTVDCGLHLAASGGEDRLDIHLPGALPAARNFDGTTFGWVCGFKPITSVAAAAQLEAVNRFFAAGDRGVAPADLLAYRYGGIAELSAFEFLNASDSQRASAHRAVLAHVPNGDVLSRFQEVSMLILLEAALGASLNEVVDRFCAAAGLRDSFVRRDWVDPASIGCLVDYDARRRRAIPFLHDRSLDFVASPWLSYVGGFSSVADMRTFYETILSVLAGAEHPGFPSSGLLRSQLATDHVSEGGFRLGLNMNLFGEPAIGHVGFLRSSVAYAEPDTGFVFAAVRRGVDLRDFDSLPTFWKNVISATRTALGLF